MGKDETGIDRLGTHVVKMLMEPHFAASPLTIFTSQDLSAGTLQYVWTEEKFLSLKTIDLRFRVLQQWSGIYTPAVGSHNAKRWHHIQQEYSARESTVKSMLVVITTARRPPAVNANDPSVDSAWPRYASCARDSRTFLMCNFCEFMIATITADVHQNAFSWQV